MEAWEQIANQKIIVDSACPPDMVIFLVPRYHPETGALDLEETAKASVVVRNVGNPYADA